MIYQNETERKLYDNSAPSFDQLVMRAAQANALGTTITNTPRAGETAEQTKARLYSEFQEEAAARLPMSRTFSTGATRDTDEGKLDYEGFLSPLVLKAFAEYMHEKRKMPDGTLRDSDNWQLGIPVEQYMKSMFRHFIAVWTNHRYPSPSQHQVEEELLALMFNVQGMLHEVLKAKNGLPSK